MKHDPEIDHGDAEDIADLLALQSINLAQCKGAGRAWRQWSQTIVEYLPKVASFDQLGRRRVPFAGGVVCVPVICPFILALKKFVVLRSLIKSFADWRLAAEAAKVIGNLVFQNIHKPRSFRSATFEFLVGLQRGEKSFLHRVFSGRRVAQPKQRVLEEVISVLAQPRGGVGRLLRGRGLRAHNNNRRVMQRST